MSQGPFDISLVFNATEDAVRCALGSVRESLRALSIEELTIGTVEIVLAEVSNNIVEHAYKNSTKGTVDLKCQRVEGLLFFEIRDNGTPLPHNEIPHKKQHDLDSDLHLLPEGGFGWGLIRDMTLSLAYQRVDGQNILRFSLPAVLD